MNFLIKIIKSIFLSFGLLLFLLIIVESSAHLLDEKFFINLKQRMRRQSVLIPATSKMQYQLHTNWGRRQKVNQQAQTFPQKNIYSWRNFFEQMPNKYWNLKSNFLANHVSFDWQTKQTIFDVSYTLGPFRRRAVPSTRDVKPERHLILSGCSYTFGDGLEDYQTLPFYLQKLRPFEKIYNLGRPGGSVVDAITTLTTMNNWDGIHPTQGVLLFAFSEKIHLERFLGNMQMLGEWNHNGAFLKKNEFGQYEYGGVYSSHRPLRTFISYLLSKSKFLDLINFDWPLMDANDIEEYALAISDLRRYYLNKYGSENKFIVYLIPGERPEIDIRPFLEKYKIYYFDYSDFQMKDYTDQPLQIPYDGHPSAQYNQLFADQITHDLNLPENQKILFPNR